MTTPNGPRANISGEILDLLTQAGERGVTWYEVSEITGHHHGTVSGNLSNMHREGQVTRLSEKRGRSKVYVLPQHRAGRATERQGRQQVCGNCGETV